MSNERTNERTNERKLAHPNSAKRIRVSPKNRAPPSPPPQKYVLFNRNALHRNACKAFLSYVIRFDHVCSFDTKSAPRISPEPFDLQSPNFTWTSIPTLSVATPHCLLPVGSYSGKACRKYRLQRLRVEFHENGLSEDHEILHTY